jgi:plasmid stabilization system protein ParE
MKITFAKCSGESLVWFQKYYDANFPEGKINAYNNLESTISIIGNFPDIGKNCPGYKNVKEFKIQKTPFAILYRIKKDEVEILNLWDSRQENIENFLEQII